MVAINEEYVYEYDKCILKNNDEIAIIPPISGGWIFEPAILDLYIFILILII